MVLRRRFLLLLGGTTTGIWLASTGLVRFERRLLLTVAGSCSFCGDTGPRVLALVGTAARSVKICDACVGLSYEIMVEQGVRSGVPSGLLEVIRIGNDRRGVEMEQRLAAEHEAFLLLSEAERQAIALEKQRESERDREVWRLAKAAFKQEKERTQEVSSLVPPPPRVVPEFFCSFCDRPKSEVATLISGPRIFICDSCVEEAAGVMVHLLRA